MEFSLEILQFLGLILLQEMPIGDANNSGISLPALMLRRSASGSKITSSTITGGVSDFSIKLYKGFTGGGNRQVELFINGVSKGTSTPFDDFSEHVFTVSGYKCFW